MIADESAVPLLRDYEIPTEAVEFGTPSDSYHTFYYRANTDLCGKHVQIYPQYSNGHAAGPIIACPNNTIINCDPKEQLLKLDVIQELVHGRAFQFALPDQQIGDADARAFGRLRMSSSTGAVFMEDGKHLVIASYGLDRMFLYEYEWGKTNNGRKTLSMNLLDSVKCAGRNDLVDVDLHRQYLIASEFNTGTQQLAKVNLNDQTLTAIKNVDAFRDQPQRNILRCHEAAFFPSKDSTVIVAASMKVFNPIVRFFDYDRDRVLADFVMNRYRETFGFWVNGLRKIDQHHMLISATSFSLRLPGPQCVVPSYEMAEKDRGKLILVRLDFSVDDIFAGRRGRAEPQEFTILDEYDMGMASVEGVTYKNGVVLVVDQLLDRFFAFRIDLQLSSTTKNHKYIHYIAEYNGYNLPHGVAFSQTEDLISVTTYGDNSFVIQETPPAILNAMDP